VAIMTAIGFWNLAEEDPGRVAVIAPDGTAIEAGDLLARANQYVHGLRSLGLRPGDTIAVVLSNSALTLELYLAALQAGWYVTPINHHLVAGEIAYILRDCEAKVLVCGARFAASCVPAADEAGLDGRARFSVGEIPGFRPIEELWSGQPTGAPAERSAGMAMHYTSGTTGRPKGVRRPLPAVTPEVVVAHTQGVFAIVGVEAGPPNVHLMVSPMYHTIVSMSVMSLHLGHLVVVREGFTPEDALDSIDKYKVTVAHMVPTMFHRLLSLPEPARRSSDVSSLRWILHAAAPCPIWVKQQMLDWWGPVLYEYYGATEGGGTLVTPQEWLARPGTVGRAWPGAEVRVLDDNRDPCPAGREGTIYLKLGANQFAYHKDPKKTESNRVDGFFTVGDVGYLDDDGYLFICDRKADMIISGGVNIYPAEIESAILEHPAVADVAVFGIPDDEWGEQVKAVVEPHVGVGPTAELEDELRAFCSERLAKFKCPRSYEFTDSLPRDPSGKLLKRRLRDPYWAGRDRAV
jgi:long-chain acyl-CoA synthetase